MREALLQPALLFVIIVQIAFLGVLTFGISLQFENDVLMSMNFFGSKVDETLVNTLVSNLIESTVGLITALLMFLYIIGSSFLFPSMLRDPLLGVTLTKPVSRTSLFLSKYIGLILFIGLSIVLFSLALWLVLWSKSAGTVSDSLIVASLSFCLEFIIIFTICSLLALVVENASGVALLGIGIYYVIGPFMANTDKVKSLVLTIVSLLLPPIGKLSVMTKGIVGLDDQFNPTLVLISFPYIVIYLAIASIIFSRKDLT
jgi:ABC-type transport system involved in multi-copper enzyme maturation permease subunit